MRKFLLRICLAVCCISLAVIGASCSKTKGNDDTTQNVEPVVKTLELGTDVLDMVVGDVQKLSASYTKQSGVSLQYSSSDTSVVSVNENSELVAEKVGSAVITATYGEQTATCNVTVTLGGMSPELQFTQILGDSLKVACGDSVNLEGRVAFNGAQYADAEIEYTWIGDADVGAISNGAFVASGAGEGRIQAIATWRGLDSTTISTLRKEISVSVIYSVAITTSNSDITLYTVSSYDGQSYATEESIQIKVIENGERRDGYQTEIIEGADVITYDDGVITAQAYGEAKIRITFIDGMNVTHTKTVSVTVERPVKEIQTAIEFSSLDGTLPLEELFGEDVTLATALQDGNAVTVDSDGKKISGLTMNETAVTQSTLTLYTATVGVRVPMKGYAKLIKTEADLKVFDLADDDDNAKTEVTTRITGYYALANDIANDPAVTANMHTGLVDNSDGVPYADPQTTANYTGCGFSGTFDGQGYELNVDVYSSGIFGVLSTGAVIKNVKIKPTFDATNTGAATVLAYQLRTKGTNPNQDATWGVGILAEVSNVYVEIEDFRSDLKGSKTSGLIYSRATYINVHDCIVEIKNATIDSTTTVSGAFFAADDTRGQYQVTYKNNYIVSATPVWVSMDSNVNGIKRNIRTASMNDVEGESGARTLRVTIGSATAGTAVNEPGKYGGNVSSVSDGHDNTTNINYMSTVNRYDGYGTLAEATNKIANWSVSATGITWSL